MRLKKGQLSVETMIIYGLVILVALSVIAGLLYFGVLDIGNYLPESCDLGGTGDLKCEEFSFASTTVGDTTTNHLQIGLRNVGQKQIEFLNGAATDKDGIHFTSVVGPVVATVDGKCVLTEAPADEDDPCHDAGIITLAPGEIALIDMEPNGLKPGKVLNARLDIQYQYKDGAVTQTAVGDLRVKAAK